MNNKILSSVLREYEKNTKNRDLELKSKQYEIYQKLPEIIEIDKKIASKMVQISMSLYSGKPLSVVTPLKAEVEFLKVSKEALLTDNGYDKDYLKEKYKCRSCKDSGYVKDKICDCVFSRVKELEFSDKTYESKKSQTFESFNLSLYSKKVDDKYGISPHKNANQNLIDLRNYAINFSSNSDNLVFIGNTGLSKTHLANSIGKVVSDKGFKVMFESSVSLFDKFESVKFNNSNFNTFDYKSCDLLIIDGLGNEMVTNFTISALYDVLNYRIENNHPTIVTTTLSIARIREKYSEAIASRLGGDFETYLFFGEDIREKLRMLRGNYENFSNRWCCVRCWTKHG